MSTTRQHALQGLQQDLQDVKNAFLYIACTLGFGCILVRLGAIQ